MVGLVKPVSGEIRLDGKPIHGGRVDATLRQSVTYVPEDRHARGFVPYLGVGENLTLCILDRLSSWGIVSRSIHDRVAADLVEQLGIVTSSLDQRVGQLSGGNQQKVVVAREVSRNPRVLIAAQPTRGLDVGAIEFVHRRLVEQRDAGKAVLLVSLELEEILSLSDRILVLYEGRIVAEFPPDVSEEEVGIAMTGGRRGEAAA